MFLQVMLSAVQSLDYSQSKQRLLPWGWSFSDSYPAETVIWCIGAGANNQSLSWTSRRGSHGKTSKGDGNCIPYQCKKTNGGKKMYTGREGHFKKNWENCFFSDVNVLELCCECYNLLLYITPWHCFHLPNIWFCIFLY